MDQLHQAGEDVGVGLRQDAVAQVEDVPAPPAGLFEHAPGLALEHLGGGEERERIEIAHDRDVAELAPCRAQVDPPVDQLVKVDEVTGEVALTIDGGRSAAMVEDAVWVTVDGPDTDTYVPADVPDDERPGEVEIQQSDLCRRLANRL